jgi:tetratricopeptide (TPR) repeat protein
VSPPLFNLKSAIAKATYGFESHPRHEESPAESVSTGTTADRHSQRTHDLIFTGETVNPWDAFCLCHEWKTDKQGHHCTGLAVLYEAIVHFQRALQVNPDSLGVLNTLAWLLATWPDARIRDGVRAVKYAGHACELTHYGVLPLLTTLAAAYAEAGRFDDATATAQEVCARARAAGEQDLFEKNQKLLDLYHAHQPYYDDTGLIRRRGPASLQ